MEARGGELDWATVPVKDARLKRGCPVTAETGACWLGRDSDGRGVRHRASRRHCNRHSPCMLSLGGKTGTAPVTSFFARCADFVHLVPICEGDQNVSVLFLDKLESEKRGGRRAEGTHRRVRETYRTMNRRSARGKGEKAQSTGHEGGSNNSTRHGRWGRDESSK
jgi:hypothetical protein